LAPAERAELKARVEQAITDPKVRVRVLNALASVLSEPPPAWEPEPLPQDKRRDAIMDAKVSNPLRVLMGGEVLLSPGDDKTYGKALAEGLALLACRMGDNQIVTRFGAVDEGMPSGL